MKKILVLFNVLCLITLTFAAGSSADTENSFSSTDEEVALSVLRVNGEVKLNIQLKDITQFDHILVERSAETPNYFGKCKYISCADEKSDNSRICEKDRYPFSAAKDVYYRIKTVTKDGVERAYPSVLLAATVQ